MSELNAAAAYKWNDVGDDDDVGDGDEEEEGDYVWDDGVSEAIWSFGGNWEESSSLKGWGR